MTTAKKRTAKKLDQCQTVSARVKELTHWSSVEDVKELKRQSNVTAVQTCWFCR